MATREVGEGKSIWIWPFELTEKLGEGGMAVVYRARYVKDDRQFAVKLLPEATVANPTMLARFQREMEVLKNLRHPNIVRCFGGVCENEQPFYAMELVEGGTLNDLLRKVGRRNWRTTAECGLQMCAALQFAHEAGVVHRDVKPSNFLIDGDTFKLGDFGLALMASSAKLTAAEKTVGTFDYMAPEQISGRQVSPQTDLYALGCVFFEMLVGRPPFESEERVAILQKHLREPPRRVSEFVHDCPAELDRLIDELLAKSPDDRPRDAAEVAERLRAILEGREPPVSARARTRVSKVVREGADRRGEPPRPFPVPEEPGAPRGAAPGGREHVLRRLIAALTLLAVVLGLWGLARRDAALVQERAVGLWIEAADEGEQASKLNAIRALGELARRSPAALEALEARLDTPDPTIRREVVAALGTAGGPARGSLTALLRMQKVDENPLVRIAAGQTVTALRESESPGSPWWGRIFLVLLFAGAVAGVVWWPALRRLSGR